MPPGLDEVVSCENAKGIAQSLVDGEKCAVFLGNVVAQTAQATQLHVLAFELAKLTGASVGFLGDGANSVGGYVAGLVPSGAGAREMFEEPRNAYVLMGVEPEHDCLNPDVAVSALKGASLVVVMAAFKHAPAFDYADVMLPITPYTETSGTFVNTEGRVQSFTGVVKPRGEARPGWKVLRVLGNVLDLDGFSYESSEAVRDEVLGNDAEFVTGLDNGINGAVISLPTVTQGLQRVADVPIHFADPMARRSPALQQTADAIAPKARMNAATLAQLGLAAGSLVRVKQGRGEAVLAVERDLGVPDGCVRVAAAHPTTSTLGEMFGLISVERA